ncbi:uncharacterized protein LOC127102154 [Lathyrus oleraceus]|uniref:uncharacterized protein LOC127102154 n=1 Tax=Pisum sativum TaxID=3888 RepID=UPI0021CE980E|nr:uncharacterized protein LOC127102154 [Pisum sativum]
MTKIFIKTLSSFYYDHMIPRAPNDFTEMVIMWMWLEEAVREGRLTKEVSSSSNVKKFGSGFIKKKEQEANSLPRHGGASVNMMHGCPGKFAVFEVRFIRESLVRMPASLTRLALVDHEHNYTTCRICSVNSRACPLFNIPKHVEIIYNSQKTSVSPLIISFPGPVPYKSDKAIPYKYDATMIEDRVDVPLPPAVNIVDVRRVTRSGWIMIEDGVEVPLPSVVNIADVGQSSGTNQKVDNDEVLKLIKKREYNTVEQLLHTQSKISVLSLLMSSKAHREALQKVLEQAYVDHDVTVGQFDGIVANITACKNLSFYNEELLKEGRNHNMALHISMNCVSDTFSNVLVDTGSSLNMMPKSTLSRLSFQGAPMKGNGIIVKAFDGSRKTVVGELDLSITIGPHAFKITFHVMDIEATHNFLLGLSWIYEAGEVTSTLHQKLQFVKNGKLVMVCEEHA